MRITADELAAAAYAGMRSIPVPPSAPKQPRTNRLAIASFIIAVAGIPLFGVLTGLVAVVVAAMALGALRGGTQRGLAWAAAGLLLGLADAVGWVIFLAVMLMGHAPPIQLSDMRPDVASFKDLDPIIGRAMRSNVMIQGQAGLGVHIGSGVILRIKNGWADVLTNRHVVDPNFTADPEGVRAGGGFGNLTVQLVGQEPIEGAVTWIAPDGVDLAIVRVACSSDEARSARWKAKIPLKVGEPVFAIGNPHGLGWTHTQGTISQFRIKDEGTHKVRVIQMQTAVNPGNSGGGLYDRDGELVGIVTWSQDKRVSEGLNFAIALESALPLFPGDLAQPPQTKD
jgi:S1-C subfamily serine protease